MGILFFGLRPKGFNPANNVHWLVDQVGIRFNRFGIAYTRPMQGLNQKGNSGFSIEMALKPARQDHPFFLYLFNEKTGLQALDH